MCSRNSQRKPSEVSPLYSDETDFADLIFSASSVRLYLYQTIDINTLGECSMPKLVDHDQYRKQLLVQCFDLFAQHGYGALTMRQIAAALNVSTGTLYHYFPTKEALFHQLVEEVTQQTIFEAASVRQHATLEERLIALCEFIAEHEDSLRKQFLITLNYYQHHDSYDSTAGTVLQQGGDRYRRAIMDLIGPYDPRLCILLQSQIHGLLMLRMVNGATIPFMEQARLFIDMLMDYLRKHTDESISARLRGI